MLTSLSLIVGVLFTVFCILFEKAFGPNSVALMPAFIIFLCVAWAIGRIIGWRYLGWSF